MLIFSSHFITLTEVPSLPLLRLALLTLTACSAVVPPRHILMGGRFSLDWGRAKDLSSAPRELCLTVCEDHQDTSQ